MILSNTTTQNGIIEQGRLYAGANATTLPNLNVITSINAGLDEVAYTIQTSDKKWSWDDTNNQDLPVATTDIVAGQQDYSLDTSFLKIKGVFYVDSNGAKTELTKVENANDLLLLDSRDTGIPQRFAFVDNSIFLDVFPTTGTAESSSIKLEVHFVRNMSYFVVADIAGTPTKTPGFNPQFHRILPHYIARDYFLTKEEGNSSYLKHDNAIKTILGQIQNCYSSRDETTNSNITMARINHNDYL